jgi:tRNA A58 N-methylase Trm61
MVCPHRLSFILYNPVRKVFTDRRAVLRESGVGADSVILEIGAGNGFFTEILAERAKFVYAVELQEGMVKKLIKRLGESGNKVKIIQGDIADHGPGNEIADVGFLYYSFHEIERQEDAAINIVKAVRANGTLAIYEPTVEVSRQEMDRTVERFELLGMIREERRDGLFTRFARLRKAKERRAHAAQLFSGIEGEEAAA